MTITSKNPKQLENIQWLLKQDDATYESHLDGEVQVVKYNPAGAYPVAAIFKNKKKNPVAHYRYKNDEDRNAAITRQIEQELQNQKWKADRKAKATKAEIKVGDIVYTSWGYEQTNIDFYLIVGLVGKATAEYVKIGSEQVKTTSWCSADVSPDPSIKGTEIQRGRIGQYGVKIGREYASKTTLDSTHHSSWGY
jgi:hypothetical protein